MITGLDIYLVTRCDAIKDLLQVTTIVGILSTILCLFFAIGFIQDADSNMNRWGKILFKLVFFGTTPLALVSVALNVTIPTCKEVAAMTIIPKIARGEKIQECGQHIYKLAREWMEEPKQKKGTDK